MPNRSRPRLAVTRAQAGGSSTKKAVLFVCLGNICRSPTAEAVFRSVVEGAGAAADFDIDSCGTGGGSSNWYQAGGFSYHEGDPADGRMTQAAKVRGHDLTSRSRPLVPADFQRFDAIVAMDSNNVAAIKRAAEHWKASHAVPADYAAKVRGGRGGGCEQLPASLVFISLTFSRRSSLSPFPLARRLHSAKQTNGGSLAPLPRSRS